MAGAPHHEQAWAEALADEHAHQRELLATLRDELGGFAKECASALGSLEAFIGLGEVATVIAAARTGYQHATLAHDLAQRATGEEPAVQLYEHLGSGDVPPPLVRHAAELLRRPKRTDRELLQAVVNAGGAQAQIEAIVGPAPIAALSALRPLIRWTQRDRAERLESAGADLTQVLNAVASLGAGAEATAAADVTSLADSLRDTIQHVESAARAVKDGKLEKVLAEARQRLEADLDRLRGVHEGATEAPHEWRAARRDEHAALTEEVRVKLERVERIRRALAALLPRLQLIARALTSVQRGLALERRLVPEQAAGVDAAHVALVLAADGAWESAVSSGVREQPAAAHRFRSKRVALAAVAVVVAIGAIAIAFAGGGSKKNNAQAVPPTTTTATTAPAKPKPKPKPPVARPRPKLSPVTATFVEADRATFYVVSVSGTSGQGTPKITWRQTPPPGNPTCDKFTVLSPTRAVWHHSSTDGCTHIGIQHVGWVYATVTTRYWQCTQSFFGTLTRKGSSHETCRKI